MMEEKEEKAQEQLTEEERETSEEEKEQKEEAVSLFRKFADIPVEIEVVAGRTEKTIGELLGMGIGSVIELDREVKDLVDIKVNGKLVAKGELVVVEGKIGVKIKEVVKGED
ncbi:MAG: flagellar motor switch protein FliN [Aquificae bacterium]|nr:flagellar motor switch protein FliN [Aquificota bacterium]